MQAKSWRAMAAFCVMAACAFPGTAVAHGKAGKRLFIEPLVTEDANPKNELDFPVFEAVQTPDGHMLNFNYSIEKLLTPKFSVSFDNSFGSFTPNGSNATWGFGNIGFGAKYALYVNAPHEFIVSSGLHWEAPTGNARIGATQYNVLTPELLYAKGFGDLPPKGIWKWLRPLAVQGDFTGDFAVGGAAAGRPGAVPNADAVLEYSIPYLNTYVRHQNEGFRLEGGSLRDGWSPKAIAGDLFPFAEFNFSWASEPGGPRLRPEGFIRPGVVYMGHYFEIGGAAAFPSNRFTGHSVGAIAIFDLFIDDVIPKMNWLLNK
ncbi:MAG TPA: hypothetical protein VKS20_12820 [Candidatus Acidoferrales bacterium]|nr:hypothetical protein [Candidatus Acidoferrales bacterium]